MAPPSTGTRRTRPLGAALAPAVLAVTLAACSGGGSGSGTTATSGRPTASSTTASTVTATAAPADSQQVDVVETGLGVYLETMVPIAVLRSRASAHTAEGVRVHLSVTSAGRVIGAADVELAALGPGATAAVAGRVAGSRAPSLAVSARVTVGSWTARPPLVLPQPTAVELRCPGCTDAGGSGDVAATVPLATLPPGPLLQLTAVCRDAAGAIAGGGSQTAGTPTSPGPTVFTVPVVLARRAAACRVEVSPGVF